VAILRSSLLCIGAVAAFGCGSGEQTDPSGASSTQPFVQVDPTVNVCPVFSGSLVIPLDIGPGVNAEIAVRASDPDGNDASLVYDWSAPSGRSRRIVARHSVSKRCKCARSICVAVPAAC
jgi:hypothetical protein